MNTLTVTLTVQKRFKYYVRSATAHMNHILDFMLKLNILSLPDFQN